MTGLEAKSNETGRGHLERLEVTEEDGLHFRLLLRDFTMSYFLLSAGRNSRASASYF